MRKFASIAALAAPILLALFASSAQAQVRTAKCATGADCDTKWQRALQWVLDNSRYPIQRQTDIVITTVTRLPLGGTDLIFTIDKIAQGRTNNLITFRAGCGSITGACVPTIEQARESFFRYVEGNGAGSARMAGVARPDLQPQEESGFLSGIFGGGGSSSRVSNGGLLSGPGPQASLPPNFDQGGSTLNAGPGTQLICKGGGAMTMHFLYRNGGPGQPSGVVLEVGFERAPRAANAGALAPGQCAYADKPVPSTEPNTIYIAGPAGDIGFEMTTTSEKKIDAYVFSGSGPVHDAMGYIVSSVMSGNDFSVNVSDISTLRLQVVSQ